MTQFKHVVPVGVTASNFADWAPHIAEIISTSSLIGLDIETEDSRCHSALAAYRKSSKKTMFDINRTDLCGMSLWPDDHDFAFYFNFGHADVSERLPWAAVQPLLELKPTSGRWVIHNASFERTMLANTVNWEFVDYICTMVMAVSAYGPDEYNKDVFAGRDLGGIANLLPAIRSACLYREKTPEVEELLSKVIAKESDAAWSYNGYVKDMAYGYGLKAAVQAFFGYQMTTYEQVLRGREHMGQLTSAETLTYGCDDSIWCVRLYHRLLKFMLDTNPAVVGTLFNQELPMVEVYSNVQRGGLRIDREAVDDKKHDLRVQYATNTRELKEIISDLLPFDVDPHEDLLEREDWYRKNYKKYRAGITKWAHSPNSNDPFTQCTQLAGPIPNAWAAERGVKLPPRVNFSHYMPMRVVMYDLLERGKCIVIKGKVQSDGWARGRLKENLIKHGHERQASVLDVIGHMSTIEQASKLYITPYQAMIDPDTDRMYPVMGSELATRRTAMRTPNATQLAKRGESVYVRGFFKPDGPFNGPSKFAKVNDDV